ncbi:MAG: hypothetical protein ACK41E_03280 [Deinococcales bacterium]
MRLDKLPPVAAAERSADERLAEAITAYFLSAAPFPENNAELDILGHSALPPTVYGVAWSLEPSEVWFVHKLGTIYHGVNQKGEFASAGAAALLVTNLGVRLMLGAGSYNLGYAVRGAPSQGTHLERQQLRYVELKSLGAGDLLILEHWKLGKLHLKIPWARSIAALIAGQKAQSLTPKVLEESVVQVRNQKRLEEPKVMVFEVHKKDS